MSRAPLRAALRFAALVAAVVSVVSPGVAVAQAPAPPRGALDQLDPAPPGDPFFSLASAEVSGRLRLSAQLLASYAHNPLVLHYASGSGRVLWVRDQAQLHMQASLEVLERLKVDLDMPVTLAVGGVSGGLGGIQVSAPSGASAGDLRAGLRIAVLHQDGFLPAAALGFTVWAPLGNATSFSGAGELRCQPSISVGAEHTHLVWGAAVGARFQSASTTALLGSRVVTGVGAAFRWAGLTVGPEAHIQFETGDRRLAVVSGASRVGGEVLLGARYRVGPVSFGLAGGPGLGSNPGTPTYRLVAAVAGTFDIMPTGDATGPASGAAARTPPPAPVDTDGDTVPDVEDACPRLVGDATPGAYRRGCPPDRDRDGILDVDDACPDVPGVASDDRQKNGCPADTDGDGIADDKDACPYEKGPASADPKLHGCPTAVRVEGEQIVILQQVNFETARAEIKPDSFGVLQQVADAMKQHPEFARVAVDGHTDSRGGDKPNKSLSERRAISVVMWLIEHGVDARRLEARGFGLRRPIADNTTDAGRAKNRRVEFQIRLRTNRGEAGWIDGPIDDVAPAPSKPAEKPSK